jgi:protein-S-isoprenylcysteine O-methyltransferase Ste14
MAWAVVLVLIGFVLASLLAVDPDLLRERAAPGPGVKRWDKIVSTLGFLGLYPGTAIVAGFEAAHFGPVPPLPAAISWLALGIFVAGYSFALWAMHVNRYFATFVRIQEDRGQIVVRTGPYARVRHPGYTGVIVSHLALPVALGARWAAVPAVIGAAFFVLRTALEDETLARELPGYAEYRQQVRWRLLPRIW